MTSNLISSFAPVLFFLGIVFVFYILPIYWLIGFAKKEHKDWRIALVTGLLFTWLFGWLIVLIVPKLSDEDHERINQPNQPVRKSFRWSGAGGIEKPKASRVEPTGDSVTLILGGIGGMTVVILAFMAWMAWGLS